MYNIIKMELYRMVRMKSFYVMMLVMIAMTFISTWAVDYEASYYQEAAQESQQSLETAEQQAEENLESVEDADGITIGMQVTAPGDDLSDITIFDMMFSNFNGMIVAFYIAIFVVLFGGADFTSGYIKNFVGQAKSRTCLVMGKAVAVSIYAVSMMLLFVPVQIAANGVFFGYIHWGDMGSFLSYFGVHMVLHIAFALICLAIVLVSRSTVISMVLTISICWNVLTLVYAGIDIIASKIGIKDFHFSTYTVSGRIGMLEQTFSRQDCIETLGVAAVYMILSFLIGSVIFTKKDI